MLELRISERWAPNDLRVVGGGGSVRGFEVQVEKRAATVPRVPGRHDRADGPCGRALQLRRLCHAGARLAGIVMS